jgi:hypothetical protein
VRAKAADVGRLRHEFRIFQVGGTSAGAPQWAAVIVIVNSLRVAAGKGTLNGAQYVFYNSSAYSTNFHDIASGSNGTCGTLCNAGPGYDFVTGLGSPQAAALINGLVALLKPKAGQFVPVPQDLIARDLTGGATLSLCGAAPRAPSPPLPR